MNSIDLFDYIPVHLPDDECWEWQRGYNQDGYGQAFVDGATRRVHRLVYALFYEPIPPGLYVLHSCDNPSCCNPYHLRLGTQHDNMSDATERDRFFRKGEANGRCNLSDQLVIDIRKIYSSGMWSYGLLAQLFDIPKSTVAHIIKHYTWSHLAA